MNSLFKLLAGILLLGVFSCKEEPEQPKVIYEDPVKTRIEPRIDTTQVKIADLPVMMEGTNYLLHPVGDVRVYEGRSRSSYGSSSTSRVSYSISNYNRFEITGYLHNIHFQHIDSTKAIPLTDQKVIIQTATYLNTLADKTRKHILVYSLADMDTNRDGKIDSNDIRSLYVSEISGERFTKLSPQYQELIDWNLIEHLSRLYFRTIEDTNKNGEFDKNDELHYYYVDLIQPEWDVVKYNPY